MARPINNSILMVVDARELPHALDFKMFLIALKRIK